MRLWPTLPVLILLSALLGAESAPASAAASLPRLDETLSLLVSHGQIKLAQAVLNKSHPTLADRIFFRGMVMKIGGRFSEAISDFTRVRTQA